jgi:hypothetical protein
MSVVGANIGAGDREGENAVAVFSLNPVRIDSDRPSDRSIEATGKTFAAMNAGVFLVIQRLFARDPQSPFLGLNRQIRLTHARELNDRNEVIALLEDINGRIGPDIGGRVSEPVTRQSGIELLLKVQKGFERIGESHDHCLNVQIVARLQGLVRTGSLSNDTFMTPEFDLYQLIERRPSK